VQIVVLAFVAACIPQAPAPVYPVPARGSVSQVYDCAIRAVNDAQFVVANADRASGVFRAQRTQSGGLYLDRLSISVYPDTVGRTMLRVVPDVTSKDETFPPSREVQAAQHAVIGACGDTH
jgi:hypothetical protein